MRSIEEDANIVGIHSMNGIGSGSFEKCLICRYFCFIDETYRYKKNTDKNNSIFFMQKLLLCRCRMLPDTIKERSPYNFIGIKQKETQFKTQKKPPGQDLLKKTQPKGQQRK